MICMKKKTEHADLVVRIDHADFDRYVEDGWLPCTKKVWRRSRWATKKDGSGPSKRVRIDPIRERREVSRHVFSRLRKFISRSKW